jgi:hypothetical protein
MQITPRTSLGALISRSVLLIGSFGRRQRDP